MIPRSLYAVTGMVVLGLPVTMHAMDREGVESVLERAHQKAVEQCRNGDFPECMGFSRQDCQAKADAIVEACRQQVRSADGSGEQALRRCLEEQPAREFGDDASRLEACGRQASRMSGPPGAGEGGAREERLAEIRQQQERAVERMREGMRKHMEAQGVSRGDTPCRSIPMPRWSRICRRGPASAASRAKSWP